jgi:predicted DNA-binding ribbon-helix-helix protein
MILPLEYRSSNTIYSALNMTEPKSLKLYPSEWDELKRIAKSRGMSRHKLMATTIRSILQNQNPNVA